MSWFSSIRCQACWKAWLFFFVLCCSRVAYSAEPPLFSLNGVEISQAELFAYFKERLDPEVYESALSKPSAIQDTLTNLYVLKRTALEAQSMGLVVEDELEYAAADGARRLAVKRYVQAESERRLSLTDWRAMAKERYILETARYEARDSVNLDHILLKQGDKSFFEWVEAVQAVADALAGGEDFYAVARQYSDDPSASRNAGALGYVSKSQLEPAFAAAAFALTQPGEISDPVVTSFGIHFIRFNSRITSAPEPYEKVEERLVSVVKEERSLKIKEEVLAPFWKEPVEAISEVDQEAVRASFLRALQSDAQ